MRWSGTFAPSSVRVFFCEEFYDDKLLGVVVGEGRDFVAVVELLDAFVEGRSETTPSARIWFSHFLTSLSASAETMMPSNPAFYSIGDFRNADAAAFRVFKVFACVCHTSRRSERPGAKSIVFGSNLAES